MIEREAVVVGMAEYERLQGELAEARERESEWFLGLDAERERADNEKQIRIHTAQAARGYLDRAERAEANAANQTFELQRSLGRLLTTEERIATLIQERDELRSQMGAGCYENGCVAETLEVKMDAHAKTIEGIHATVLRIKEASGIDITGIDDSDTLSQIFQVLVMNVSNEKEMAKRTIEGLREVLAELRHAVDNGSGEYLRQVKKRADAALRASTSAGEEKQQ